MKKINFKFRLWLSLFGLLVSSVLLAGCTGYSAATPTPASQSQVIQAPVVTTQPATTSGAAVSHPAQPTVMPEHPSGTNTPKVDLPNTRQAEPTSKPAGAAIGLVPSSNFNQFPYADSSYFVHIPATLPLGQPAQVVLAIHGMSNNGLSFAEPLVSYADRYNLILVAPTMKYDNNYVDASRVAANDEILIPELQNLVDELPAQLHMTLKPKILLFGFSRGAQIVHRFAFFYPKMVLGVAAMSAGNYTLPTSDFPNANAAQSQYPNRVSLPYPFGVADFYNYAGHNLDIASLQQIPFWLAVGGSDNLTKDVPPAWSPYQGQTRLDRATHFYETLQKVGIPATLTIVPGVGHIVCSEMKQGAFNFFSKLIA